MGTTPGTEVVAVGTCHDIPEDGVIVWGVASADAGVVEGFPPSSPFQTLGAPCGTRLTNTSFPWFSLFRDGVFTGPNGVATRGFAGARLFPTNVTNDPGRFAAKRKYK